MMIDIVPAHCSDLHPWFEESRQSRDNPKADWFRWVDPNPDGTVSNGGYRCAVAKHGAGSPPSAILSAQLSVRAAEFEPRNPEVREALNKLHGLV